MLILHSLLVIQEWAHTLQVALLCRRMLNYLLYSDYKPVVLRRIWLLSLGIGHKSTCI